ncbi:hypothetical protein G6F46_010299 [Rhizopus delemar]|uniref:Uncharacterized protein n=2 Tax=Rhizopus TaxID=4842 RepID=A0A9P6YST0_9FUNG|nr:hypothetical protein G6F36_013799 [Rhizopus arrhizus]KAG1455400.1 hypothetical protein G6F55_007094 [Rhizopus delemar]KAG1499452.1 hypothetical protein G6F54_004393 [Rhizopus delemar]KAG1513670.1 hypothetical protein G6F53_004263 [Rhizopus delemar]KAG1514464.1 hypothetical protein G6F52_009917 [Rhizopus delemar]
MLQAQWIVGAGYHTSWPPPAHMANTPEDVQSLRDGPMATHARSYRNLPPLSYYSVCYKGMEDRGSKLLFVTTDRDCPLTLVTDAKSRTKSLYALAYGLSGGHAPRRPSCLLTRYLLLQKASPDFALLCHS